MRDSPLITEDSLGEEEIAQEREKGEGALGVRRRQEQSRRRQDVQQGSGKRQPSVSPDHETQLVEHEHRQEVRHVRYEDADEWIEGLTVLQTKAPEYCKRY